MTWRVTTYGARKHWVIASNGAALCGVMPAWFRPGGWSLAPGGSKRCKRCSQLLDRQDGSD